MLDLAAQLKIIKRDPLNVRFIPNPYDEVLIKAIKKHDNAFYFIAQRFEVSEQVQLFAIKQCEWSIRFIQNPSETVQLAAVKKNGLAIQCIKTPSERVQLAAIKQSIRSMPFIDNPTEQVQMLAIKLIVERYPDNITQSLKYFIKDPCDKALKIMEIYDVIS